VIDHKKIPMYLDILQTWTNGWKPELRDGEVLGLRFIASFCMVTLVKGFLTSSKEEIAFQVDSFFRFLNTKSKLPNHFRFSSYCIF